jgi:DNA-directed RNA polymerase specialized sigma24 family protein
MPATKTATSPSQYATSEDFERIFDEEMNSLYLLSFLLAADETLAEQCFVSGLQDAVNGNRVFKEWAHSWAERVIIQNAVRVVRPRPEDERAAERSTNRDALPPHQRVFAAILELDTFARFVYVITVLERYSDQECSVLLGCSRRDVLSARVRALESVGTVLDRQGDPADSPLSEKTTLRDLANSAIGWLIHPRLAISA